MLVFGIVSLVFSSLGIMSMLYGVVKETNSFRLGGFIWLATAICLIICS